jgi:hypothetical protein
MLATHTLKDLSDKRESGEDGGEKLYLPPKRPALLNPRPQRFVLTRLSLYSPLPVPAAGPVGGCFGALKPVSMGSSKP